MKALSLPSTTWDTKFYGNMFKIAIPVALQSFMSASLNLIDNIMVGQLGESHIAGVGLANQFYFILLLIQLGIAGGSSVFISQYWGSKNFTNIKKILGLSLILALSSAALFFIAALIAPKGILSIFSSDTKVIELGGSFLSIICFSYILSAISACYSAASRSTGNASLPMIASVIALIINTLLNYLLIFGKFGLPALGIRGSAIATVIARIIEACILLSVVYTRKGVIAGSPKELFIIPMSLVKRFMATSSAVIFKDIIWVIGITIYMVIYAHIGTEAVASVNIVQTVRQLGFVLFSGIANACLIMVGNQIGANDNKAAYTYARRFLKLTVIFGLAVGTIVIISRTLILSPYNVSHTTLVGAKNILLIFGIILTFDVFNMVSIVGIMRSGGDVTFCIIMDIIAVWFIGLPLALLGTWVFHFPIELVYGLVVLQEIFKFVLCYRRIASKKWINNLVQDI